MAGQKAAADAQTQAMKDAAIAAGEMTTALQAARDEARKYPIGNRQ
jgi:hypothetical protein